MSKIYTEAEQKISRMFTCSRAIAIWTVIAAHVTLKNADVLSDLYGAIGTVGVALFFIMAGYFYKKEAPLTLLKKKSVSILVPWFILGSVVWFGNALMTGGALSITQWVLWLVGYKTYLYYVIMLLGCFVLFYFHNRATLFAAIAITLVSLTFTAWGVMDPIIQQLHITNYLNILNWVGFFALGMLLKRVEPEKLYGFIHSTRWVWMGLSVLLTVIFVVLRIPTGYFTLYGWAYELVCTLGILSVCTFGFVHNKAILSISRYSYAIYLLHMLFVGILGKVYLMHPVVSIFANTIVLLFTWLVLVVGQWIAQKIRLNKIYGYVIGLRIK